MEIYNGKIKFNDTATNPKGSKRFFGLVEMIDAEGDTNSYQMISFRSQVVSQSENLGKNGMMGKEAKIKGVFEINSYNGKDSWQLKVEELYIIGMENLAEDIKNSTDLQLPAKPSNVSHPTNPVAPLVENIPTSNISGPSAVMPMPGNSGGYVYQGNGDVSSIPGQMPQQVNTVGAVSGGYVYKGTSETISQTEIAMIPQIYGGYVYKSPNVNTNHQPSYPLPQVNGMINPSNLNIPIAPQNMNTPTINLVSQNPAAQTIQKPAAALSKFKDFEMPDAY